MRALFLSVAVLALAGLTTPLYATPILFENFDALSQTLGVTSAGAFSAINGTNVDVVGPRNFPGLCATPEAGNCVDLNGSGGNPQGQLQSNMLFAAGSYLLSFDLVGTGRGSTAQTTVNFGDYNSTFNLGSADDTSAIIFEQLVTLATPGYLNFDSDTQGNMGTLLDDVEVDSVTPSSTPEPASLLLLGTALILAPILISRRKIFGANSESA